jgi:hypothetical protein
VERKKKIVYLTYYFWICFYALSTKIDVEDDGKVNHFVFVVVDAIDLYT